MRHRLTALALAVCMLAACLLQPLGVLAEANTVSTGTVINIDDALRVRDKPTASNSTTIGWLYNGDVVTILGISEDKAWYNISKGNLTGWSSAEFIKINATYQTDEEFEAHLIAQGFPEDYKVALRQIHAEFPSWIFTADHLSMTWATALKAESKVGKNTITSPDAWKSMEYGAYDWGTNSYVSFDSGGWVAASGGVIAYHMDPRNFLDSTYIFQFEELSYSDSQTADGIRAILPDALDKHADDLLKASKEAKVSAYFLATRMAQEGSQNNGLGLGTVSGYEGYYNFFHIGAYAHSGRSAVQNGAIYAKDQGWNTPYKCLLGSAQYIGKGYINLGQDTLYYQKFNMTNTTSGLYAHQYMTNVQAAASEGRIRRQRASKDELANAITFSIPVYKEMPATVAAKPATTGNNNNFLDSLTVKGHELTPSFDRYTMAYSLHVGDATEVEVSAVLNNSKATLTGAGTIRLFKGDNEIAIPVTATSGEVRTYKITITTTGGVDRPNAPAITGKVYTVSDTITKVEPETGVDKFIENLAVSNGTAKVFTADGQAKTTGHIATGDIVRLYSGETLCASYPVVIYGDVNGDGKITSLDLRITQKHILGVDKLTGYSLTAADAGKDGNVTSLDLRVTQKHILGITKTLQ